MSAPQTGAPQAGEGPAELWSRSPEQTRRIGEALGRCLRAAGACPGPGVAGGVVAVMGPLGVGKTVLVQGLARGLGASGYVRSPTFTLIHEYRGPVPLYHVDLYRIDPADLDGLALEEILEGPGLTVIEWAERAEGVLPAEHLRVEMEFGPGADDRLVRLVARGPHYGGIAEAVRACASSR